VPEKQEELPKGLQNRLEALARGSKKSESDAASAKAKILHALDSEQAKLAPSISTQMRTTRATRNWRRGKLRDWIQDGKVRSGVIWK
jgi:hypothetical protein